LVITIITEFVSWLMQHLINSILLIIAYDVSFSVIRYFVSAILPWGRMSFGLKTSFNIRRIHMVKMKLFFIDKQMSVCCLWHLVYMLYCSRNFRSQCMNYCEFWEVNQAKCEIPNFNHLNRQFIKWMNCSWFQMYSLSCFID
jgi:hypothetical protein